MKPRQTSLLFGIEEEAVDDFEPYELLKYALWYEDDGNEFDADEWFDMAHDLASISLLPETREPAPRVEIINGVPTTRIHRG